MDELCNPATKRVVLMGSAQIGKTEAMLNAIGFYMQVYPSPIIVAYPSREAAEDFSKNKLDGMIRATPELSALVRPARSRDSGNTITRKRFKGGEIRVIGTNSTVAMRAAVARLLIRDEIDDFPLDVGAKDRKQGSPLKMLEKRTTTFPDRKIFDCSTPTIEGLSHIEKAFEAGDQRRYHVPCPQCGEYQILKWDNVKFDVRPAYYLCVHCGAHIPHEKKEWMLERGEWTAEKCFEGAASFHLNEIYSPFVTWDEMADEWIEAQGDPAKLKTFINLHLGETFNDEHLFVPPEYEERSEVYVAEVPDGVLLLVAGLDVQNDRIEIQVIGSGKDDELWVIDYIILYGDPTSPALWKEVEATLSKTYADRHGRRYAIECACIDSGGSEGFTDAVYRFTRRFRRRRWYAIKGASRPRRQLVPARPSKVGPRKDWLFEVGTEIAKTTIFERFERMRKNPELTGGPGYIHVPAFDPVKYPHFDETWWKQLFSERPIRKLDRNGRPYKTFVLCAPNNEVLDTFGYGLAALALRGASLDRRASRQTRAEETESTITQESESDPPDPPAPQPTKKKRRPSPGFGNGWVNNW